MSEDSIPPATEVSARLRTVLDDPFLETCVRMIKSATSTRIDVPVKGVSRRVRDEASRKLEAKGYKVNHGDSQREGAWFIIEIPM